MNQDKGNKGFEAGDWVKDAASLENVNQALKEEVILSKILLDSLPVLFVLVNKQGDIFRWNKSVEALTGLSSSELSNTSFANLLAPNNGEMIVATLKDTFDRGESQFESGLVAKNGLQVPYMFTGTISIVRDEKLAVIVGIDISKQREDELIKEKLESQLQQAQRLESLGTLAGGITHDFNNILTPLVGHSEYALSLLPEGTEAYDSVETVHSTCQKAVGLVRQILTFSRRQTGNFKITNAIEVIKGSVQLLRSAIPTTIEINEVYKTDFAKLSCDPTQIQQIIVNLGTNAHHAMEKTGGAINIEVSMMDGNSDVEVRENLGKGDYLLLSVKDSGVGMDEQTKSHIFDPFFTTKEQGKGTGLGMSVTFGIVKNHGGYIDVYSELGKGTQFNIYLPLATGNLENEPQSVLKKEAPGGTEAIMVVDDESTNVKLFITLLGRLGYKVFGYTNSEEALNEFLQNPEKYDLILADHTMPGLTGLQFVSRIRELGHKTMFILISGLVESIPPKLLKKNDVNIVLSKPIMKYDLAVGIRSAFEKQ